MSDPLKSHVLYNPWNSPGQNTKVDSLFCLQGIFTTQGSNPGLPHYILYQLSHHGSPQILEWVAYPFSSRSSQPRNQTRVSCMAGIMLKGEVYYYSCCCFVESKSFATPIDCSTPCSSVHGDFPGKNTGVVAIPFSRGSSQPRDQTRISCLTSGFFTTEAPRYHMLYCLGTVTQQFKTSF